MASKLKPWQVSDLPNDAVLVGEKVGYTWGRCDYPAHTHTIECLWVWHDCDLILDERSIAPGKRFGWRPVGVGLHTLVQLDPLTITASVYWPGCCGLHGFITNGAWHGV